MKVEIWFDVARGEGITLELDNEDSAKIKELLDEGKEVQKVFFPDYEI